MKKKLLKLTVNKLITNYTHLGFKQHLTSQHFRKAICGVYSGISIIDPLRTLLHLRDFTKFFINLLIKNQRVCLIAYNIPDILYNRLHLYGNFFIYNNWPAGLITNFRRVVSSKKTKDSGFFTYIPTAFILFDLPPQKSVEIVSEANKFLLPTFTFVDSNTDLSLYPYWIPTNLKSGHTRMFLVNYIASLFSRSMLLKRRLFYIRAKKLLKVVKRQRREALKDRVRIQEKLRRLRRRYGTSRTFSLGFLLKKDFPRKRGWRNRRGWRRWP